MFLRCCLERGAALSDYEDSLMPAEQGINQLVADKLRELADLLQQQDSNPFRVSAYRRAAEEVTRLEDDLRRILEREGLEGLTAIPNIGPGIAAAIAEILHTGRWSQLERLRGTLEPERLFQTVPGIGPALAKIIHDSLHVDTLEALEVAAQDGRLEDVPGVGPRRAAALRAALSAMLGRVRRRPQVVSPGPEESMLLDVDREYQLKARRGVLSLIVPRRFNPDGRARLPVLHARREHWNFTALYSHTALAHELGQTRDWVVIYFYDGDHREGQSTIVTETRGPLIGKRVIRGRERECRDYYISRGEL